MTDLLVKLFIKNADQTSSPKVRERYGMLSSWVAIVCNLLLFAAKFGRLRRLPMRTTLLGMDGLNTSADW